MLSRVHHPLVEDDDEGLEKTEYEANYVLRGGGRRYKAVRVRFEGAQVK
jgi:hypothetical protein